MIIQLRSLAKHHMSDHHELFNGFTLTRGNVKMVGDNDKLAQTSPPEATAEKSKQKFS